MDTRHTPGPWWVRRTEREQGRFVEHWLACDSGEVPLIGLSNAQRSPTIEEADANARLMAAAPDLADACLAFNLAMNEIKTDQPLLIGAWNMAARALDKALGETICGIPVEDE